MVDQNKIVCGIYVRVSTNKQGDSVENQTSQAAEYIGRMGPDYILDEECVFIDNAVSGYYTSVFDREAMKKAVEFAKLKRYQIIVFKEVSRVGRDKQENPAIIGMFEQYGVRVIAINDNYDSKNKDNITFDILSVLAEQESKKISVRVSSAKRQKARRGLWNTDAPIGYILNSETKKLEIDPNSAETINQIFDLYTERGYGTFLIAQHLNEKGIKTRDGNLFSRSSINKILRNPVYIGNTVYGKRRNELKREYEDNGRMTKKKTIVNIDPADWTTIENTHPAIINNEVYYKAQSIMSGRTHHREPRRAYHPLTGIMFCKKCGAGMVCQKRSFKDKEYRYYICKTYHKYGRNACPQANVNADELESKIIEIVKNRLRALLTDKHQIAGFNNRDSDIEHFESEIRNRNKLLEKLNKDQVDLFNQRDLFTDAAYKQQMLDTKKRMGAIEEELGILDKQIKAAKAAEHEEANMVMLAEDLINIDLADVGRVRTILHEIIKKIDFEDNHFDIKYRYLIF